MENKIYICIYIYVFAGGYMSDQGERNKTTTSELIHVEMKDFGEFNCWFKRGCVCFV